MNFEIFKIRAAAEKVDWQQIVLNGGPACFHMDPDRQGKFCLRAERWPGHKDEDVGHKFVSLADLIDHVSNAATK